MDEYEAKMKLAIRLIKAKKWEDRHFKEIDDILADINSVLDDSCNSSGNQVIDLGSYKITAFCPCAICCGEWAKNRQDGIVVGGTWDRACRRRICRVEIN